jgi:hypothetical protein
MRVLMTVRLPHETFNAAVRNGTANEKIDAILEATKPEAAYFTEMNGKRTAIVIAQLDNPSMIPTLAEPWFLTFDADVEFHPAMIRDDVEAAGLEKLGKTWG